MPMIAPEKFHKCFPIAKNPEAWADAINLLLPQYGVAHVAEWLAQCGHESQGFTRMVENLNYSAQAMAETWPGRYAVDPKAKKKVPNELAVKLHRKPEALANNVYANRLGNGDEASGDGWKHRGHGLIQLTGLDNQLAFAKAIGKTIDEALEYMKTIAGAVESACWYWKSRGLEAIADDFERLTKKINGGLIGINSRRDMLRAVKEALA